MTGAAPRVLTRRVLNRTLMQRQHLLERVPMAPTGVVDHLVGLQAQENLPPYLGLRARISAFDPRRLSDLLADRSCVRLLTLRCTVHLHTTADALRVRPVLQDMIDRRMGPTEFYRHIDDLGHETVRAAARAILEAGPLSARDLGVALAARFPDHDQRLLQNAARGLLALPQLPPRGLWRRSGRPVYALLEDWAGAPLVTAPDARDLVRRYLRAFGPASIADVTTWSGMTGVRGVVDSMTEELVRYGQEKGPELLDLAGLPLVEEDVEAPVRFLGTYDNVFIGHADRSRIIAEEDRRRWATAPTTATGQVLLVDGMVRALWSIVAGRVVVQEPYLAFTRAQQEAIEAEAADVEDMLTMPAA